MNPVVKRNIFLENKNLKRNISSKKMETNSTKKKVKPIKMGVNLIKLEIALKIKIKF